MWALTKYLAELDFRMRCQNGEAPAQAWEAVQQHLPELLEPSGYSLTYFAPELRVLRQRLLGEGSIELPRRVVGWP